jgi:hypothetical protein
MNFPRSIAAAVLVGLLALSQPVLAATPTPLGDPFAGALQFWSTIVASIESAAHELATAFIPHQSQLTDRSNTNGSNNLDPPPIAANAFTAGVGAALPNTATSSQTGSTAISDQTTQSQFVNSAVPQSAPSKSAVSGSASSKNSPVSPSLNSAVVSSASPQLSIVEQIPADTSTFVTQDQFNTAMAALESSVQQLLSQEPQTAPTPQQIAGNGNPAAIGAGAAIDQLSNVTITNSSLAASEIPDLSSKYLSLSGGTLTGALNSSSTATSTFAAGINISAGCFSVNGTCISGGAGAAGGSNTQIQFNNAGVLTGDANLTWNGSASPAGLLTVGNASLDPYGGTPLDLAETTMLVSRTYTNPTTDDHKLLWANLTVNPTSDSGVSGGSLHSGYFALSVPSTNTGNFDPYMYAVEGDAIYNGSGHDVGNLYGIYGDTENDGSGTVDTMYGIDTDTQINGTGSVGTMYGVSSDLENAGTGAVTTAIAYWAGDIAGVASNPYYSWFDSQGVRRVKEDSEIDGIGQAIEALYNDQFTKYTPGAANYERLILGEWNRNNVAEIGTENGGTGQARAMAFITASTTRMTIGATGLVGIGTTTPYSRLEVWGPDTASTTAFLVANSASTTEFAVYDTGNATLAGGLTQNSDQRLKTNIQSLNGSSTLAAIDNLNPVTFNWIDPNQGTTPQLGFIAQQVQSIFPNLVSTTSPTALTPNGTLSLNYIGLISPIVSAIQALSADITSLENTIAGFAQSFTTQALTAAEGHFTNELCVGSTCVTPAQFQAMVAAANQSSAPPSSQLGSSSATATASSSSDSSATPPVLQVNGDNPAIVQVGATYTDLGATITGPQADLNLGIQASVDGGATTTAGAIEIDTSQPGTHAIEYIATDQNGLEGTATRTVNVISPAGSASTQSPAATSTDQMATSTTPDQGSGDASSTEATTTAQ